MMASAGRAWMLHTSTAIASSTARMNARGANRTPGRIRGKAG